MARSTPSRQPHERAEFMCAMSRFRAELKGCVQRSFLHHHAGAPPEALAAALRVLTDAVDALDALDAVVLCGCFRRHALAQPWLPMDRLCQAELVAAYSRYTQPCVSIAAKAKAAAERRAAAAVREEWI